MAPNDHGTERHIFIMQVVSLALIWLFVSAVSWWILTLIVVSIKLNDAINASVGISIIVIPIFITLAGILTYVFVGLQRHQTDHTTHREVGPEQ